MAEEAAVASTPPQSSAPPLGFTVIWLFYLVFLLFFWFLEIFVSRCAASYLVLFQGLSFAFPIPSQYSDCCHDGEAELPLEFHDGTTPVTCRVSIYDSSAGKKVGVGSLMDKASAPPLPTGSLYMEEVHAKLGEELFFTVRGQHIPFGASPQDVWSELGRPCGIHQKQVDQMVIHSASDPRPRITLCADYFYNYFTRDLDILFDGQTHKVKKFVLHTNYPGHADFNSYIKCNFVILVGGSFPDVNNYKNRITPSTKWEQVKLANVFLVKYYFKDLLISIFCFLKYAYICFICSGIAVSMVMKYADNIVKVRYDPKFHVSQSLICLHLHPSL
ncbi:hypothetical protein CXB51_018689 [Gossypium anomalum]|uniref:Uncharacterized protein n=1 Tax=Gossypium anomalum TaxID=47600 RepID=A0A8J5YZ32_9ROSI|nr:hypothetical protein CXB51_018689 [Gossypium anomalum]